eukprot:626102-Pleurochrysis_carterae.AAC.3
MLVKGGKSLETVCRIFVTNSLSLGRVRYAWSASPSQRERGKGAHEARGSIHWALLSRHQTGPCVAVCVKRYARASGYLYNSPRPRPRAWGSPCRGAQHCHQSSLLRMPSRYCQLCADPGGGGWGSRHH